jgi:hypothetical protein
MKQMEILLKGIKTQGIPASITIPEFFCCPICDKDKTSTIPSAGISDETFLPIGVRFHGNFGFYDMVSVQGFMCFLLITEAVTGYKWIFCRGSKHPPINLLLWFIKQLRICLGVPFAVLQTNDGGELWGCKALHDCLLEEMQCTLEPTGPYNLAANGMVIGEVCIQAQICQYASGLDVEFWCFALSHAALLCNMRPQIETQILSRLIVHDFHELEGWCGPAYLSPESPFYLASPAQMIRSPSKSSSAQTSMQQHKLCGPLC